MKMQITFFIAVTFLILNLSFCGGTETTEESGTNENQDAVEANTDDTNTDVETPSEDTETVETTETPDETDGLSQKVHEYLMALENGEADYGYFHNDDQVVFVYQGFEGLEVESVHLVGSFTESDPTDSNVMEDFDTHIWIKTVAYEEVVGDGSVEVIFDFVDTEGNKLPVSKARNQVNEEGDSEVSARFSERTGLSFAAKG